MRFLVILILTSASYAGVCQTYAEKQVAGLSRALITLEEKIRVESWKFFPCDSCLKKGDTSTFVQHIRNNLFLTGDWNLTDSAQNDFFDTGIHEALVNFQKRNGLNPDGVLGKQTIGALNIPLSERIARIKRGIEYWKAFATKIQEPYILVNLPDFSLSMIDSGRVIKMMKVIIGKKWTRTPVFQDEIEYLVITPYWIIPKSIATREILPILKGDPDYLSRNHMEVFTYYRGSKIIINADTINWSTISAKNFNYYFQQVPGPWNALGQIKFIFPNNYRVYIHDTPDKKLFDHRIRAYSHGCIRAEKPLELAAWLLNINKSEATKLLTKSKADTVIDLTKPVPVAIDYFTVWIGEDNSLQFRDDIYGYEEKLFY